MSAVASAGAPAPDELASSGPGLSRHLAEATRRLHAEAERTGFVADLLRGRAGKASCVLYLRSLQPVYRSLEEALQGSALDPLAPPALVRSAALECDLLALSALQYRPVPAAQAYAQRINWLARAEPRSLLAHAYVRYLGDLSGGFVLRRLLADKLQLRPSDLAFCSFPEIADTRRFKDDYRSLIDDLGRGYADMPAILEEARLAFRYNIELSLAIAQAD